MSGCELFSRRPLTTSGLHAGTGQEPHGRSDPHPPRRGPVGRVAQSAARNKVLRLTQKANIRMALNQSDFPKLWSMFQYLWGGPTAKRKLAAKYFPGRGRVLEVGCSTGMIAPAFGPRTGVSYLGVDIDPAVINYARKAFSGIPGFDFQLSEHDPPNYGNSVFDFVLIAGVLHHIDDDGCRGVLRAAASAVKKDGVIAVSEPLLPLRTDPFLVQQFIRIEQGAHVRTGQDLRSLLTSVPGILIEDSEQVLIGANAAGWPKVARFGVFALKKCESLVEGRPQSSSMLVDPLN